MNWIFAILSGGAFGCSWLWQVYISKIANKSVVDFGFWILRATGIILLSIHAICRHDWALLLMNSVGLCVYGYNIYLIRRRK